MQPDDWKAFAAIVSGGGQAKFFSRYSQCWVEGIILENQPFSLMDREEKSVYTQDALRFLPFVVRDDNAFASSFHVEVERALYLVGEDWLTIIQVFCFQ